MQWTSGNLICQDFNHQGRSYPGVRLQVFTDFVFLGFIPYLQTSTSPVKFPPLFIREARPDFGNGFELLPVFYPDQKCPRPKANPFALTAIYPHDQTVNGVGNPLHCGLFVFAPVETAGPGFINSVAWFAPAPVP